MSDIRATDPDSAEEPVTPSDSQRAPKLEGSLGIRRESGSGTTVVLRVPLSSNRRKVASREIDR
jgi:hypothetical protein